VLSGWEAAADAKSLRKLAREKAERLAAESMRLAEGQAPAKLRETLKTRLERIYPNPARVPLEVQLDAKPAAASAPAGDPKPTTRPAGEPSGSAARSFRSPGCASRSC